MRVRRFFLLSHRWVGLASSFVLAIVGVTGAVLLLPETSLPRRVAGRLHSNLALGSVGLWIVYVATALAVFLHVSGFVLWWKHKRIRIRSAAGWEPIMDDVHHAAGVVTLPLMAVLAVTALAMPFGTPAEPWRRLVGMFHTAETFSVPIKLLYAIASMAFALQGVTGIVMWWAPLRRQLIRRSGRVPGGQ